MQNIDLSEKTKQQKLNKSLKEFLLHSNPKSDDTEQFLLINPIYEDYLPQDYAELHNKCSNQTSTVLNFVDYKINMKMHLGDEDMMQDIDD